MKNFKTLIESVLNEGKVLGDANTIADARVLIKKKNIKFDRDEKSGNLVTFYGGKNSVAVWDGTSGRVTQL